MNLGPIWISKKKKNPKKSIEACNNQSINQSIFMKVLEGNTLLKTLTKMCEIYFHVPTKKKELITLGAQHSNLTFTVLHNPL